MLCIKGAITVYFQNSRWLLLLTHLLFTFICFFYSFKPSATYISMPWAKHCISYNFSGYLPAELSSHFHIRVMTLILIASDILKTNCSIYAITTFFVFDMNKKHTHIREILSFTLYFMRSIKQRHMIFSSSTYEKSIIL
jgi:hypothetical protein